jgi:uncharacterized membrane protein
MLDTLFRIALGMLFVITCAIVLVNGLFMLLSPAAWFALPKWIGFHGAFARKTHGSGLGAVVVRLTGFILAVIAIDIFAHFVVSLIATAR